MFQEITEIKGIGIFKNFAWNDLTPFNKVNIIYGYNGGGKTTLSKIFQLFSKNYKNKIGLYNSLKHESEAQLLKVKLNEKSHEFNIKDSNKHNEELYVFNDEFVSTHVFSGSKANIQKFDDTEVSLVDKEVKKIEDRIYLLKNRLDNIKEVLENYQSKFDVIWSQNGSAFRNQIPNRNLTNKPTIYDTNPKDSISQLQDSLQEKYKDYKISQEQEALKGDINKLSSLTFHTIKFSLEEYRRVLSESVKRKASSFIEEEIEHIKKHYETDFVLRNWYLNNKTLLENFDSVRKVSCPLCKSDITDKLDFLMDQYANFFNDEYNSLEKKLNRYLSSIKEQIEQLSKNYTGYLELKNLATKYNYNLELQHTYEIEDLSNNLSSLKNKFETKLKNKSTSLNLSKTLLSQIKVYNKAIQELNTKINKFKIYLEGKEYDEEAIIKSAKEIVKKKSLVEFNSNSKGKKPYERANKAKNLKNRIQSLISKERTKKQKAISKLKQEALYVNYFLRMLGTYNFEIDITDSKDENLKIIYTSTSQIKETLKHTLSSGEKTTLAYAYFLSKIKFEIIENKNKSISDCIFVIDDPISSLDENRIYTTANLTWNFYKEADQLFVLSHNLTFLKFFNNIVEAKNSEREDYLLRKTNGSSNIEEIPNKLRNYLSTYFLKIQDIKGFADGQIAYNEAKKFIPNHIRVVLETFLSFKFGVVKNGTSNDKYRLPGLNKLIGKLRSTNFYHQYDQVGSINKSNLIDKLVEIKRISDPHSHGSVQSLDSLNFISASELKSISNDTLNMISFLDNIHFQKSLDV